MSSSLEIAIQAAIAQCQALGYALHPTQITILRQVLADYVATTADEPPPNPLAALSPRQRQALLDYLQTQGCDRTRWKAQLMNDWLQGNSSGALQFIRDDYGLEWLDQITTEHLAVYLEAERRELTIGDRIEVSNGLWEWVQEEGPCAKEWIPCLVVALRAVVNEDGNTPQSYQASTTCIVRFEQGQEFEIQGIYEWNRYQWRWPSRSS